MRYILLLLLAIQVQAFEMSDMVKLLKREEGFSSIPYKDTRGYWTIGYGHRCSPNTAPMTKTDATDILMRDIRHAEEAVYGIIGEHHPDEVVLVVTAMIFQMGEDGVRDFKRMIHHIRAHNYEAAAVCMLHSDWAKQTPARCRRMAAIMDDA